MVYFTGNEYRVQNVDGKSDLPFAKVTGAGIEIGHASAPLRLLGTTIGSAVGFTAMSPSADNIVELGSASLRWSIGNITRIDAVQGTVLSTTPFINHTVTWNSVGVTFTNFLSNVTDTASAAASLLMDLRVGGATKFNIDKAGGVTATGFLRVGASPATSGIVRIPNNGKISARNAANSEDLELIHLNASNHVVVGGVVASTRVFLQPGSQDIQWGKPLVALGGGAAPTLGTIGGSGPATAAQDTWMRVIDSTGAAFWVPAWK